MPDTSPLTEAFEAQRDRLRAVAYRVLGSHADAEDVVQDAWLRLSNQDATTINNLAGWLTTVVGRLSLDVLRSRQSNPDASYDEQFVVTIVDDSPSPDEDAALADSVGLALLVVLESLGPSERLAFVLHDLFGVTFDEIGQILGRTTNATKMLASRARKKIRTTEHPPAAGRDQRAVVDAFLTAAHQGDFEGLLRVLDPDVKLTIDAPGGEIVVLGATQVATGAQRFRAEGVRVRAAIVNGLPGFVAWRDGTPLSVMAFAIVANRITEINTVTDPAKLASIDLP
jgi:RNA polymerase sigma factor (sigma-70 family)